jgi:hypothetical protein
MEGNGYLWPITKLDVIKLARYTVALYKIVSMKNFDDHEHWENLYMAKQLGEVSWFLPSPGTSLAFLKEFKVPLTARIIDTFSKTDQKSVAV